MIFNLPIIYYRNFPIQITYSMIVNKSLKENGNIGTKNDDYQITFSFKSVPLASHFKIFKILKKWFPKWAAQTVSTNGEVLTYRTLWSYWQDWWIHDLLPLTSNRLTPVKLSISHSCFKYDKKFFLNSCPHSPSIGVLKLKNIKAAIRKLQELQIVMIITLNKLFHCKKKWE